MIPTPTATGRAAGDNAVAFERRFDAPIEDVWAAVTESERLARWIGTWTGDPRSGTVEFTYNAEGDDVPSSTMDIDTCEPPRSLAVRSVDESGTWDLRLRLDEVDGGTRLVLTQVLDDLSSLDSTGPGWDYYLDRLVAAETGGDVGAMNWDRDYMPLTKDYARLAEEMRAG